MVSQGETTSNETIKWWVRRNKGLPDDDTSKIALSDIIAMTSDDKTKGKCHIEFQTNENGLCGHSLEEAIRNVNRKHYNLGKRTSEKANYKNSVQDERAAINDAYAALQNQLDRRN